MNRRSFFSLIAGAIGGVIAAFAPIREKRSSSLSVTIKETPWDKLGCKNCFRGCGQWDECMTTLRKRVEKRSGTEESFIYRGFCFSVGPFLIPENRLITLHPFYSKQGIEELGVSKSQFDNKEVRYELCDSMIRRWKKRQIT